ncbi:hypothetical protein TVAG_494050 [Trichomonas vaginalis G3]|uniref:Uncharacterized protein n=1 Tax=Trichomonas vaginalis (strain ATCC PRA-98 / G3) TaxID=412133 RepID=A2DQ36_TRIV3|nr:hypothetical protein TVAGG3_0385030 [Trichomonas vaginalis G3]EAY17463.1 hypothetical protein TVAG_494050 [Trichomonas vaginalis G3]KAI5533568.1 hypothetical protein TVAGG3_0385030 [Trichomonas vaginalis G3]|eukprot:XP_001329598.1 hypothetical protein [Trichomonas vaginalis G3]
MFNSYSSSEIHAVLASPNPELKSLLAIPSIVRAIKQKPSGLMNFLLSHADEMLAMVFSQDKSIEASRAYSILVLGDPAISSEILKDDKFRNHALEALVQPDVPGYVLGRLSSLTLTLLQTLPADTIEHCGFIYHLLKHCANPSVYNFFISLTNGEETRFEKAQEWLVDFGFSEYIIRELQSVDFKYQPTNTNPYLDPVYDKLSCLYQLVKRCSENKIMEKGFKTNSVVQALLEEIPNAPDYVKNAHWAAITAVTCQPVAVECLKLIPTALKLITEPFVRIRSFRVSALTFLTQMMEIAPMAYELLLQSSVLQSLCTVLIQFPNCTILHGEFRKFVETGLKNEQFAEKMVGVYTPLFIDQATGRINRVLSPTLFAIVELFNNKAATRPAIKAVLNEIPEYRDFYRNELLPYNQLCNSTYGGSSISQFFGSFKNFF